MLVMWGLRLTTFLTNSLVLVGFALLYNWLQNTDMTVTHAKHWRLLALTGMTYTFVILFHFSSVLQMASVSNPVGYGWTYLNFQGATLLFALLSSHHHNVFYAEVALITIWYWWLPRVPYWPLFDAATIILMYLANHYGDSIGHRIWLYYPFGLLFMVPFFIANLQSVGGIDVGWPWQIITMLIILFLMWQVHYQYRARREHEQSLMNEARIDDLTGLNNFRVFDTDLHDAFTRLQDHGERYALYTFDIDHFKHVNDTYGHIVGNIVLKTVSQRLNQVVAHFDYVARTYRTGGEEFSILLLDVVEDFGRAAEYSTAIQKAISELTFTTDQGQAFHITISVGQDRSIIDDRNYLDIYKRADKYLYSSKNHGRNAITIRGITIGTQQSIHLDRKRTSKS